ncbi:hypothetical protein D9C73_027928 [Collichthys lucidus]|uniref:Uncharacterized protein n=1 Tax=Collichthys lucidus TaxID=240159 RepID=A0A4U5TW90_COLLU|nr:hypothetical protein D9C73_027928 [Collichthys lucidus]
MENFNRRYNQRRVTTAWTPLPQEPAPWCEVSAQASATLPSPSPDHVQSLASAPPILDDHTAADMEVDTESPCPPTPPSSPLHQEVSPVDEIDGVLSSSFFTGVKAAVMHLLNITVQKYRTKQCYGCQTNHPSQRHHPCLDPVDDEYYRINFQGITKMLFTHPHFIPSVQRLLTARNIREDDGRVRTVALTILHELRSARNMLDYINSVYDELIDRNIVGIRELTLLKEELF